MTAAPLTELLNLFAWPLPASRYAELVNPLWSRQAGSARVEHVWDETHDTRTLTLRPGRGWRGHRAGQHVRLSVPAGGRTLTRTYSLSSAPERRDGLVTITVKAIAGGRVSQELVRRLRPGAHVRLSPPEGDFVLPEDGPARPLFVTAGSGITPVMSMLRSLAARGALLDVVHLHFAPHRRETIFGSELAGLAERHPGYRLSLVETRTSPAASRHLDAGLLERSCPGWREREAYVCGPRGLLESVEGLWEAAGLGDRLHVERFVARRAEPPADVSGGRVSFARSRAVCDADGQRSLLGVAEDVGLSPAHGCRMGICHSCDVRLLSGCVRDLRTNLVTKEPGTISLCVSAAAGDAEIDL